MEHGAGPFGGALAEVRAAGGDDERRGPGGLGGRSRGAARFTM
uniref:Uncharacterized protein n=1 Tax=Arundo donax TaxID=35708 RepID=A0A0A9BNL1_ARUDO